MTGARGREHGQRLLLSRAGDFFVVYRRQREQHEQAERAENDRRTSFAKRTSEREEPSAAIIEISPVRTENTTGELSGYIIVTMRSAPERRMKSGVQEHPQRQRERRRLLHRQTVQRQLCYALAAFTVRHEAAEEPHISQRRRRRRGTESHAARPPRLAVSDGTRRSAGTSSVTEHSAMS